jgi:hypothetical protein
MLRCPFLEIVENPKATIQPQPMYRKVREGWAEHWEAQEPLIPVLTFLPHSATGSSAASSTLLWTQDGASRSNLNVHFCLGLAPLSLAELPMSPPSWDSDAHYTRP